MLATQPRSLRDLSPWLVGSEEIEAALRTTCAPEALHLDHWREQLRSDNPGAFLLVEGHADMATAWAKALDPLLDACGDAGVPRLLWITTDPVPPALQQRSGRFEQVFAAERWQVPALEAAGAREPSTLWPATSLPLDPEPGLQAEHRPDPVVWLGGWRPDWSEEWRGRLAAVLRGAARRGLRIVPGANLSGLPTDLRKYVDTESDPEPLGALRRARVAIGADPAVGSPAFAPRIIFDATACGAAVLTPHDFVSVHELAIGDILDGSWRNMVPIVHDADIVDLELHRLLDDDSYRVEVVRHMRQIVANNHTFAHRLASLGSAAGHRLLHETAAPMVV